MKNIMTCTFHNFLQSNYLKFKFNMDYIFYYFSEVTKHINNVTFSYIVFMSLMNLKKDKKVKEKRK